MKTWHVKFNASFLGCCGCVEMAHVRIFPACHDTVSFPSIEAKTKREAINAAILLFRLDHPEADHPGDIIEGSATAWVVKS